SKRRNPHSFQNAVNTHQCFFVCTFAWPLVKTGNNTKFEMLACLLLYVIFSTVHSLMHADQVATYNQNEDTHVRKG
ncbi:hypothetical protein GBAR_LOCUS15313, partial [Geodia barretti]